MSVYKTLKALAWVFDRLPLSWVYAFGRFLGLLFFLSPGRRRAALRNIKLAFPQKSESEYSRIFFESTRNMGLNIVEILASRRLMSRISINGLENIPPEGAVIVSIHSGNWELGNCAIASRLPLATLVKEQKIRGLDAFLNEFRRSLKVKVCFSLKAMVRQFRAGASIALMADHGAEDNAVFVNFFSHSVPTPGGAVYLASHFKRQICPVYIERQPDNSHMVVIAPAIDPLGREPQDVLKEINAFYENYVREHPGEYFWGFKRFKRKRDREVVVLNDSRLGHLKQSLALVELVKEIAGQGFVRLTTVDIRYRLGVARFLSELCALLSGRNCFSCGRCLKVLLEKRSWDQLKSCPADIVVSAGNYLAPVNRVFAYYAGARAVTVLRPNLPPALFDLCVIPAHDRVYHEDNTVVINGALTYPCDTSQKEARCREEFKLDGGPKVSLFLGGSVRDENEFLRNLEIFLPALGGFCRDKGFQILISTSRRTSPRIEEMLERFLKQLDIPCAAVFANRVNYDFVFEGFVGLSQAVFVSGESISMISEVMALKKPCVCLVLETHADKHNVFIQSAESEGAVLRPPYDFSQLELKVSSMYQRNKTKLISAVRRIVQ